MMQHEGWADPESDARKLRQHSCLSASCLSASYEITLIFIAFAFGCNIGANKLNRVREGFRAGLKLVWLLCLPLTALYLFGGKQLLLLFMNEPSQAAMNSGLAFLRIVSPFYFVISAKLVADGILRGASEMGKFMTATFTDLILRVLLAIALSGTSLGSTGIWCAWPIGWSTATIFSLFFYRKGIWYTRKSLD